MYNISYSVKQYLLIKKVIKMFISFAYGSKCMVTSQYIDLRHSSRVSMYNLNTNFKNIISR